MAKSYSWGSAVTNTSFSGYPGDFCYRGGISWPTFRVAANGNRPAAIYSYSAVSLSNGYMTSNYGSGTFGNLSGSFQERIYNTGGTMTFGRSSTDGGTITDNGDGGTWSGSIPGSLSYAEVPSAPQTPAASSVTPASATVTWTAPSDDGGASVTGYRVQRALDSGFTTSVVNFTVGVVYTYSDTTVTPGTTYYYRVFAINSVATGASTTGPASTGVSVTVKAGGRRWDGSVEVSTAVAMRWDGSAEVPITTAVRWNGTAEVALT